jgi:uncharacterized phosphosugar-binding protein
MTSFKPTNSTTQSMGPEIGQRYFQAIHERLAAITQTQGGVVEAATDAMASTTMADELIYVYGAGGHSYIGSEEFFSRAGGLANISPLYEPSLALAGGGRKSTMLERVPGIGDKIVSAHELRDDLLIITSAYGINSATIDAAFEAKRRGCTVIGISSFGFAEATPADSPARHPSLKNLHQIVDVAIDNHVPHGEAILNIPGFDQLVGGTCSVLQCFIINWLVARTAEKLVALNVDPPIWRSYNIPGGDEHNRQYVERYNHRVKML